MILNKKSDETIKKNLLFKKKKKKTSIIKINEFTTAECNIFEETSNVIWVTWFI